MPTRMRYTIIVIVIVMIRIGGWGGMGWGRCNITVLNYIPEPQA